MVSPQDLLTDKRLQVILEELKPALPVLLRMGYEKAIQVLDSLLSEDSTEAMIALRRTATPAEWQAFLDSQVMKGNKVAAKAIDDVKFLRKQFLELLLVLAPLVV